MTQREKWLAVAIFMAMFVAMLLTFAVGLDDDPKPARTPGMMVPTGVQCDPDC